KLTEEEAAAHRSRFFALYRGVRTWHQRVGAFSAPTETRTLLGRRRLAVEKFTEKLNSPIQGTGADMLKLALSGLLEDRAAIPSARLVLVVHDEIVIEVDASEAAAAAVWLKRHMEAAAAALLCTVPVVVKPIIARTWADMKE